LGINHNKIDALHLEPVVIPPKYRTISVNVMSMDIVVAGRVVHWRLQPFENALRCVP
jgi:hypothetical protein